MEGADVTLLEWQIGNDWSIREFPSSWVIPHMFTHTGRLHIYGRCFVKIECPLPRKHGNQPLHKAAHRSGFRAAVQHEDGIQLFYK